MHIEAAKGDREYLPKINTYSPQKEVNTENETGLIRRSRGTEIQNKHKDRFYYVMAVIATSVIR